jgi:hypothetical protein
LSALVKVMNLLRAAVSSTSRWWTWWRRRDHDRRLARSGRTGGRHGQCVALDRDRAHRHAGGMSVPNWPAAAEVPGDPPAAII